MRLADPQQTGSYGLLDWRSHADESLRSHFVDDLIRFLLLSHLLHMPVALPPRSTPALCTRKADAARRRRKSRNVTETGICKMLFERLYHAAACVRAASEYWFTFIYAVMNGPMSHGHTVP